MGKSGCSSATISVKRWLMPLRDASGNRFSRYFANSEIAGVTFWAWSPATRISLRRSIDAPCSLYQPDRSEEAQIAHSGSHERSLHYNKFRNPYTHNFYFFPWLAKITFGHLGSYIFRWHPSPKEPLNKYPIHSVHTVSLIPINLETAIDQIPELYADGENEGK